MSTVVNGNVTPNLLTTTTAGKQLAIAPAASYERLNAAFVQRFGKRLDITYGYRSIDQQWALFRLYGYPHAAIPGTSNHGLGLAVDLGSGVQTYRSPEWSWMNTVGRTHGWVPLNEGNLSFEPWHWAYLGHDQHAAASTVSNPVTVTPAITMPPPPAPLPAPLTQEEEDMASIIQSPSHGLAVLDGGRLVPIGDTATADAFTSAGAKRIQVTDADFLRLLTNATPGVLLFNPPAKGGHGWAYLTAGHSIGLGDQATVNALHAQGVPVVEVGSADFDRLAKG